MYLWTLAAPEWSSTSFSSLFCFTCWQEMKSSEAENVPNGGQTPGLKIMTKEVLFSPMFLKEREKGKSISFYVSVQESMQFWRLLLPLTREIKLFLYT